MDMLVRSKLEMVARVREFCRAHLATEPGYAPILIRLEDRQGRATAIAAREQEGRTAARGARAHRRELRRVLHFQVIRYLVAVGSVAARDQAEVAERFKLTSSNATNAVFVASVKALLAAAESQRDLLVKEGMKEGVLEALSAKVSERHDRRVWEGPGVSEGLRAPGFYRGEVVRPTTHCTGRSRRPQRDIQPRRPGRRWRRTSPAPAHTSRSPSGNRAR